MAFFNTFNLYATWIAKNEITYMLHSMYLSIKMNT